jgi:hypothetical protein
MGEGTARCGQSEYFDLTEQRARVDAQFPRGGGAVAVAPAQGIADEQFLHCRQRQAARQSGANGIVAAAKLRRQVRRFNQTSTAEHERVLVDNRVERRGLLAEHGLSPHVLPGNARCTSTPANSNMNKL